MEIFMFTKAENNTYKDNSGKPFTTPDNNPPISGTTVKTYDVNGVSKTGIWNGSHVVEDKKN
jgi:hypothetical protein